MPERPASRRCPNCSAIVLPGRETCISCGMAVATMPGYRPRVIVETGGGVSWVKPAVYGVLALLVVGFIVWRMTRPGPKPWLDFPTDADATAQRWLSLVAAGGEAHGEAFKLMSLEVRHPDSSDDDAQYRGNFRDISLYLSGEFGNDWVDKAKIARAPDWSEKRPTYVVTVETETLHLALEPQLPPPERKLPDPTPPHYGVTGISEFPFGEVVPATSIVDAMGHLGIKGGGENLQTIVGAMGGKANESRMMTKRRCLPVARRPSDNGVKWALYQLWRVRQDPTVRRRLEMITEDQRYAPELQGLAKRVLDGSISDEELIGARVPDN